jgi:hypothetical protein
MAARYTQPRMRIARTPKSHISLILWTVSRGPLPRPARASEGGIEEALIRPRCPDLTIPQS